LEGLVGPLPTVAKVPRVPRPNVHALEEPDEDGAEVSLVADAVELELLKPCPGRA
jgi:hypothetical protein